MSSSKEPLKFSRRNLLKLMGFGAASAYLAACSPAATASPTALPTLAPSPTPVPPAATATAASTAVAVTNAKWSVSGNYFESCSCDYLCPCISQPDGVPTQGFCAFGMLFHIDQGRYMATQLDGLNLVVVGRSPEAMGNGNWSVGLITDDLASAEQAKALAAIFGGQDGGPMAAIAPVVGTYLGVEAQPIHYENTGMKRSVSVPGRLDQVIDGVALGADPDQPLYLDNAGHFVNTRLALARAEHTHLHAFGLVWDSVTGKNNGHYAPFSWTAS